MEMLGKEERPIGGDGGQRDFDQRVVGAADDQEDGGADGKADEHPAAERPKECGDDARRRWARLPRRLPKGLRSRLRRRRR